MELCLYLWDTSGRYSVRTSRIWKAQLLRKGSPMSEPRVHRQQNPESKTASGVVSHWAAPLYPSPSSLTPSSILPVVGGCGLWSLVEGGVKTGGAEAASVCRTCQELCELLYASHLILAKPRRLDEHRPRSGRLEMERESLNDSLVTAWAWFELGFIQLMISSQKFVKGCFWPLEMSGHPGILGMIVS